MERLGRLLCFAIILAVAAPTFGGNSRSTARCAGSVRSGGKASCGASIVIPHFNGGDTFDYSALVARIDSPQASVWRVSGTISDARGVVYFAWYCSASRSTVVMGSETTVGHSCEASRKTVNVQRNGRVQIEYYVADTSRPQNLWVTADVRNCVPTGLRGCGFEASATYQFAG